VAVWHPVLLLARRVTFCIAKPTPAAATDPSRPLGALLSIFRPSVHRVPVAFSYAKTCAKSCAGHSC
jgi:hypothetical protein